MSEYSTVDFSVLLLMGTYVLSSFCSGQRCKCSVKSSSEPVPSMSLLGTDSHPGRHSAPSWLGPSSRVLLTLGVPLPAWHYCQSLDCSFAYLVQVSHGIFLWFVFLPLWRSRGISGKDTRAGGWEKFLGPAWGWTFTREVPLPVNSYRGAWVPMHPIKTSIWDTVAVGDSLSSSNPPGQSPAHQRVQEDTSPRLDVRGFLFHMQTSGKSLPESWMWFPEEMNNKKRHWGFKLQRTLFWLSQRISGRKPLKWKPYTHKAIKVLLLEVKSWQKKPWAGSERWQGLATCTLTAHPQGLGLWAKPQRKLRWLSTRTNTTERDCSNHLQSSIAIKQAGKKTALLIILFPQKKIKFSQLRSHIDAISVQPKRSEKKITPSAQVEVIIQQQNFAGFCCFVVVANCLKCVICWHFWLVKTYSDP